MAAGAALQHLRQAAAVDGEAQGGHLRQAVNGIKQKRSLNECFDCYNRRRSHQSLG